MTDPLNPEGEYTESEIPGEPVPGQPLVEGEYTDSELPLDAAVPKDADAAEVDEVEVDVIEVDGAGAATTLPPDDDLR